VDLFDSSCFDDLGSSDYLSFLPSFPYASTRFLLWQSPPPERVVSLDVEKDFCSVRALISFWSYEQFKVPSFILVFSSIFLSDFPLTPKIAIFFPERQLHIPVLFPIRFGRS